MNRVTGLVAILAMMAFGSCGSPSSVPDGWHDLGSPQPCYDIGKPTALAQLEAIAPGHAAPVTITCYEPARLVTTSAGWQVWLFNLVDGTQRAVGVWCSVGITCGAVQPADYFATPAP